MNWIKGLRSSIWIALLAFAAAMAGAAALRHKKTAAKWQEKSVAIEAGNVVKGIKTAEAASTQAKLSQEKAKHVEEKAKKRIDQIGQQNEEISSILDTWRAG